MVVGCGGMWQGSAYVIWGSGLWHRWGYVVGWGHVVGYGSMWQGVVACGRGGGRVWGHVAGVGVCGRGQAYGIDGDMWHGVGT